jgi:hypothetical protein
MYPVLFFYKFHQNMSNELYTILQLDASIRNHKDWIKIFTFCLEEF